jgi:hypothetical protein
MSNTHDSHQEWPRQAIQVNQINFLRKNYKWAKSSNNVAAETLTDRLEEYLVLEIIKDGETKYHWMNARMLYKHVLSSITHTGRQKVMEKELKLHPATQNVDAMSMDLIAPEQMTAQRASPTAVPSVKGLGDATNDTPDFARQDDVPPDAGQASASIPRAVSFRQEVIPEIPRPDPSSLRREKSAPADPSQHLQRSSMMGGKSPDGIAFRERLGGYLHPRDMRRLITPFSSSNEPALIVRRHVMVLNFDPLRAIVLRDRLIVLVPDGADALLAQLESRVRGDNTEMINDRVIQAVQKEKEWMEQVTHGHNDGTLAMLEDHLKRTRAVTRQAEMKSGSYPKEEDHGSLAGDTHSKHTETTDGDEWDEMEGSDWIDLPFELQCADACFYIVSDLLSTDTA